MDGLTFQRFLMATFCVICQSVTRGIALPWLRDVTKTRFRSIQRYGIDFLSLVQFCYGTDSGTGQ